MSDLTSSILDEEPRDAGRFEDADSFADRLRRFVWPDDGRDPVARALMMGIVIALVAVLATLGYGIYAVTQKAKAPRTLAERQLMLYESLVKGGQTDPKIWSGYAAVLVDTKQYALAEQVIDRGIKAAKNDSSILLQRARLHDARGQQDLALKDIQDTLAAVDAEEKVELKALQEKGVKMPLGVNDATIGALVLRAGIYERLLKWSDAATAYTAALKEDPTMSDILVMRGAAYVELDQPDKARADFTSALKMAPDYAPALQGLERLKKETGK